MTESEQAKVYAASKDLVTHCMANDIHLVYVTLPDGREVTMKLEWKPARGS